MGFPVLRLPSLVFGNVHRFLKVPEIILLSLCSKRMKKHVRFQEAGRQDRQLAIEIHREHTSVEVVQREESLFTWKINPEQDRNWVDLRGSIPLNIDGVAWFVKEFSELEHAGMVFKGWYSIPDEGCYWKDLLTIVKLLRELFNCSISRIELKNGHRLPDAYFKRLFVDTDALHRADSILISERRYQPRDMDFMLDHFITDKLRFEGYGGPEYSYQKPLNFPQIHLSHATWLNFEKLLEVVKASKIVKLYGAKLISDTDINWFIKWWLASDNKTLETVKIARGQNSRLPNLPQNPNVPMIDSDIMEGIESTPGKRNRVRIESGVRIRHNWEQGLDITRKDGVEATILVKNVNAFGEFYFYVWPLIMI